MINATEARKETETALKHDLFDQIIEEIDKGVRKASKAKLSSYEGKYELYNPYGPNIAWSKQERKSVLDHLKSLGYKVQRTPLFVSYGDFKISW